jgi:hypothetical protein
MKTWASRTQKELESIGASFVKMNEGGREWWECRLEGHILASNRSLGDCIRAAADSLGGM